MVRRPAGVQVRADPPPSRHVDVPLRAEPHGPPGMRMRADAPSFWPCWWSEAALRELQRSREVASQPPRAVPPLMLLVLLLLHGLLVAVQPSPLRSSHWPRRDTPLPFPLGLGASASSADHCAQGLAREVPAFVREP
eukprot:2111201-Alexandrium_andersonii.AAC.1